ncbi:MAG: periplasmic heavy metal sensor [Verrucomicrobia bacterium]|jgi:Spy/CpxP family protein refolding chaperone|nr:periplasmic heavy metal sensor [Verrucomicrobiota bacterium]
MNPPRSRTAQVLTLSGLVAALLAVCVVVSLLTASMVKGDGDRDRHEEADGHQWLRQELDLTDEQAAAIDAFEPEYRRERARLQQQFEARIEQLREAIMASDEFSPQVRERIHELHVVHGRLQELSIRHYYRMLGVLPPEKQDRLRRLAGKALSVPQ